MGRQSLAQIMAFSPNMCQAIIVNWTLGNNFELNFNWNSYFYIQENVFENDIWKVGVIEENETGGYGESLLVWRFQL